MRRDLYGPDHEAFREVVMAYVKREVIPNQQRWEQERNVGRPAWLAAGARPARQPRNDRPGGLWVCRLLRSLLSGRDSWAADGLSLVLALRRRFLCRSGRTPT